MTIDGGAARYSAEQFQILVRRETDDVELKSGLSGKKIQEVLVAMSNTHGGSVFFGVDDDRNVVGCLRTQGVDDAIHQAALAAVNVGRYAISTAWVEGVEIVVLDIDERTDEVAQTSDGRVLQRRGGRNIAVFGADLWRVMSAKALRRYESTASGVATEAIDPTLLQRVALAFGWADVSTIETRLVERGLATPDGQLTVAGALTLTDPGETVAASKFHVDIRSYESDQSTSYVRREIIPGPLQRQAETATDWVIRDIGTELVVTGAMRHDVSRLPRRVVRETIANAVAHRDYTNDRTPIVIEIRPSSVTITSPGILPPPVTIATLREAQSPRNHTVIDVLRRFGLAEDSGQGIDVIEDGMRFELLDDAEFTEGPDRFGVRLPLTGQVSATERGWLAEFERQGRLQPTDRLLLLTVLRDREVSNARARDVLGVDSVQARSSLQRLRDAGLLEQHGTRGRSYYTLGAIGPDRTLQEVLLEEAVSVPLTNARVRNLTGLDRSGAGTLLKRMVDEGLLEQHGERRTTHYVLRP